MKRPAIHASGDRLSIGQVAERWGKPGAFVKAYIDAGHLVPDEDGRIPNSEMQRFYREHGTELD